MQSPDFYFTDLINIITPAYDEWNAETGTTIQSNVKVRIEDSNQLIKDQDGKEVVAQSFLMVDSSADIKYESRIQLVSRNGVVTGIVEKEFPIKKLSRAHGFGASHWEVWL